MADICSKKVRDIVYLKYGGKCAYCGSELNGKFTVDHIKPKLRYIKRGMEDHYDEEKGKDEVENFNPCCSRCNSSKWSYDLETWRGYLSKKTEMLRKHSSDYRTALRFGIVKEIDKNIVFYFEKIGGSR